MPGSIDDQLGFAPDYDSPVPYMQRTRDYYTAIGYTTPYRWAHYADAPFQPLKKPLAQSRVTIITTAAPYDPAKGDQGPGAAYNGGAKFYKVYDGDTGKPHDLRISHIGYDRKHTSATDSGTCRGAGTELPGLPPDFRSRCPPPRSRRHFHRGDGMRQGYRRARCRAALPVL